MDLKELIKGIEPEVVEQELILDGTGNNFRPVVLEYTTTDGKKILEKYSYSFPTDSDSWRAVNNVELKEVQ